MAAPRFAQHRAAERESLEAEFGQEIDRLQKRCHGAQSGIADALNISTVRSRGPSPSGGGNAACGYGSASALAGHECGS